MAVYKRLVSDGEKLDQYDVEKRKSPILVGAVSVAMASGLDDYASNKNKDS